MELQTLVLLLIFSIPLTAILGGFGMEWLKMRAKQKDLGTSNREMEQKVERLERTNAEMARRVENLETIVVSQTWSALQEPGLSESDRQRKLAATVRHEPHAPETEEMNRQRAEQLARRLGG